MSTELTTDSSVRSTQCRDTGKTEDVSSCVVDDGDDDDDDDGWPLLLQPRLKEGKFGLRWMSFLCLDKKINFMSRSLTPFLLDLGQSYLWWCGNKEMMIFLSLSHSLSLILSKFCIL